MKGMLLVLVSIVVTILCWGTYGPILKTGQDAMHSGLRPFICVGLAYFVIAVIVPIVLLRSVGEKGHWSATGLFWSLFAGIVTAVGALGIILAYGQRGSPIYVMPLVFGLAPVVNSLVTIWLARSFSQINSVFTAGLILVVAGAVTVLLFTPHAAQKVTVDSLTGMKLTVISKVGDTESTHIYESASREEFLKNQDIPREIRALVPLNPSEWFWVIAFTLLTAICWGVYGPFLHKGQMAMAGSRLRPLLCVGLAYFLIAVIVPAILLSLHPDGSEWFPNSSASGMIWSLAGGAVGAIGALGVIMAFNFGGKPVYVMPLIFGGAPIVNTFVVLAQHGATSHIGPVFVAGLIMTGLGAMTVLMFAPRGHAASPAPVAKASVPSLKETANRTRA